MFPPAKSGAGSPFEGGVVGMIDYLIYTESSFPTGVVDSIDQDGEIRMVNIIINHPGRYKNLYHN
jgi:hypothetical protein